MINRHRLHRSVGILLLSPLVAWSLTGLVFLIQPGYGAAYEFLQVRTYPLASTLQIPHNPQWQEVRVLRTVLGTHLLVKTEAANLHLDASNGQPFAAISDAQAIHLVNDAVSINPARYGEILTLENGLFRSSTGIEISLNWDTLSLQQYGRDTLWIDRLYKLHYLQWTGIKPLDKLLGVLGLFLLIVASITGAMMLKRSIKI